MCIIQALLALKDNLHSIFIPRYGTESYEECLGTLVGTDEVHIVTCPMMLLDFGGGV